MRSPLQTKKRTRRSSFTIWSGRRVSNSRPQPWQGCALPTELLPHGVFFTSTAQQVHRTCCLNSGAGEESRTLDLNLGKVALYQLSYSRLECNTGGEDGNRTRLNGFAGRCITSLLPRPSYAF